MYLESGDCYQQTIISCGNDLARVSNKSPRTDSLTYEDFVPRIQIRGIVLSKNTPAEKWFVWLIHIHSNSHNLCYKDLQLNMNVYNHFVCLLTYILNISNYFWIFLWPPHLIFNWGPICKFLKFMTISGKIIKFLSILLMDVPGRISRNQNRRNYVVNWILQIPISDYHRAMLSLGFYSQFGSSSRRQANTTLMGRRRTGSRQPFETGTSLWKSVAGGDPGTGAACRGAWQPFSALDLSDGSRIAEDNVELQWNRGLLGFALVDLFGHFWFRFLHCVRTICKITIWLAARDSNTTQRSTVYGTISTHRNTS